MKKIVDKFKQIDSFGESIKFNIKGGETYNTCLGSLITLFIYMTVLIYGSTKFKNLSYKLDTNH